MLSTEYTVTNITYMDKPKKNYDDSFSQIPQLNSRTLTSSGKMMTGFCLVTLVTLLWKYSLQEAKTEQWARKLLFSTTTVTSHRTSCCLWSFRHWRTCALCTADWKVNTDMRGAWSDMVLSSSACVSEGVGGGVKKHHDQYKKTVKIDHSV